MRYASANSRGARGGHPLIDDSRPMETVQASRPVVVIGGPGTMKNGESSVDDPAPTVMAHGMAGVAPHQVGPVGDIQPRPRADGAPPYRVPSMCEVAAVRGTNGFTVVSTFSGCGGSCLGFEMAGYRVLYASEFIPAAAETYRANHPGVYLDTRDVREVTADDVLRLAGVGAGEVDVLEGSPPCAAFSTAGRRAEGWGQVRKYSDTKQRVDDLFFEFVRLVDGVRPKVFVAENVSGLVKGVAKGYFKEILRAMKAVGYRVEARLLDAQWLGVPQSRQRIIFVGVREDLDRAPAFPRPLPYRYSLRDAIGDMTTVVAHRPDMGDSIAKDTSPVSPASTVLARARHATLTVEPETDISRYAVGAEWDRLAPGQQSEKYFDLVRPDERAPSPAVTASGGSTSTASVTHPTERRKFTIAELRRVCGFPDDFVLTGTYAQQWERLGRAVPPPMMRAVAETVRDEILYRL